VDGNVTLPPQFHCPENTVSSLIESIYPGIKELPHPPDSYFAERAILSARNDDVDELNARVLNDFPGQVRVYHSADSIVNDGVDNAELLYPVEFLNSITASGLPLAKLALKVGCPVMIMRNLNPTEGVCNGTRGVITRMTSRVLEVRMITGENAGNLVFIPRLKIMPTDTAISFELCRLQFPVRLGFSMSINKGQGQSMAYVGCDFRSGIFTHGQFYVAVSTATSIHRIKAIWNPSSEQGVTKNIVYPEVLLSEL
jgi:ATP-dependent exoDNAse (exonuclease V) alpha subunit